MGTSAGGTLVTITGVGFSSNVSDVAVSFDGVDCSIITSTST